MLNPYKREEMETNNMNPVNGEKEMSTGAAIALTMFGCACIYVTGKFTVRAIEYGIDKTVDGVFWLRDKMGKKNKKKK